MPDSGDLLGSITDLGPPTVGGLAAHVRLDRLPDGREVVVKRAGPQPGADTQLAWEATVLDVLAGACGAPLPVASAPGVLVTTRLPGRVDVVHWSAAMRDRYVAALCDIHDFVWPTDTVPGEPWSTWVAPDVRPPSWSGESRVWAGAIDIARRSAPSARTVFCHGDFHPGNVLIDDLAITGVVDWGAALVAPAAVDVAHLAHNVACLHSPDAALEVVAAYRVEAESRGRTVDDLAEPFWWAHEILSWLPDPAHILPPWAAARPDLTEDLVRRRSEQLLRSVLARAVDR